MATWLNTVTKNICMQSVARWLVRSAGVTVMCGVSLFADAARADSEGTFELGGQIGLMMFDASSGIENGLVAGARLGYFFTNDLEAEALILTGSFDLDDSVSEGDADVVMPALEATYHLSEGPLRPFVSGGLAVVSIDGRHGDDDTNLAFPLGGGVKYMLNDELAVRGDGRWIINTNGGRDLNEGTFTVGLSWNFGGEPTPSNKRQVVRARS